MLEATCMPHHGFISNTARVLFCWQLYNCGIIALCQANSVCAYGYSYVHTVRGSLGLLLYNCMLTLMTVVLY